MLEGFARERTARSFTRYELTPGRVALQVGLVPSTEVCWIRVQCMVQQVLWEPIVKLVIFSVLDLLPILEPYMLHSKLRWDELLNFCRLVGRGPTYGSRSL